MDYMCTEFGVDSSSCILEHGQTYRQTDRHTHTHEVTDATDHLTNASDTGVGNHAVTQQDEYLEIYDKKNNRE